MYASTRLSLIDCVGLPLGILTKQFVAAFKAAALICCSSISPSVFIIGRDETNLNIADRAYLDQAVS
jgi:hypothetical protein